MLQKSSQLHSSFLNELGTVLVYLSDAHASGARVGDFIPLQPDTLVHNEPQI